LIEPDGNIHVSARGERDASPYSDDGSVSANDEIRRHGHWAEIGIFHRSHLRPSTVEELAKACRSNERGIKALLDALVSFRLVTRNGKRFTNSAFIAEHFTPAASADFTPGLLWSAEAWRILGGLTAAVRSGAPTISLWKAMQDHPEMGALFSRYIRAFAQYFSPTLLAAAPIDGARRRSCHPRAFPVRSTGIVRRGLQLSADATSRTVIDPNAPLAKPSVQPSNPLHRSPILDLGRCRRNQSRSTTIDAQPRYG
jgi:hypothetical protein